MTQDELKEIRSIKAEISSLENRIDKADQKTIHRFEMLERKVDRAEDYIDTVEGEMQQILRMRYIYGLKLEDIGDKLYCDKATVCRKLEHYFATNATK